MFHGHKYKGTFLLFYHFPPCLLTILLLLTSTLPPGGLASIRSSSYSASSGSGLSGSHSNYYYNSNNVRNSDNTRAGTSATSSKFHSTSSASSSSPGGEGGGSGSAAMPEISEDTLRREFIKVQILQRLGLSEKPQVDMAHKISKDLVLETLRRTENLDNNNHHHDHHQFSSSSSSSSSSLSSSSYHHSNVNHYNNTFPIDSVAGLTTNQGDQETGVANYAKTSEIISFPDKGPVLNDHNLLTFSYAGSQAFGVGVRVKKAHLWVKLDYRSSIGRHFGHLLAPKGITLYVFQVHGNFSNSNGPHHSHETVHLNPKDVDLELVVKRTISLDALGWQKLDVTSVVQKWYGKQSRHRIRHAHSHHNRHHNNTNRPTTSGDKLTLLVDCSGCGYCIQPIIFSRTEPDTGSESGTSMDMQRDQQQDQRSTSEELDDYGDDTPSLGGATHKVDNFTEMPFLVLETESAPNSKRSRRRALECSPRVKHCCKQRFYISFKDLDWDDWIIAPRGYYANYCRGSCGGPHRTPDTFLNYHTHVLEEYRRTPEGQVNLSGITPCCAPTKFAPMSLIYFGPDLNIIKRDLPKMIVEECGCP